MAKIEQETNKTGFLKGIEHVFLKMKLTGRKKNSHLSSNIDDSSNSFNPEELKAQLGKNGGENVEEFIKNYKEIKIQQKQADNFLNAQLPHLYFAMIDNGYQPTQSQTDIINEKVNKSIRELTTVGEFESIHQFVKYGYKLSIDNVYQIISSSFFQKHFFNEEFLNANNSLDMIMGKTDNPSLQAVKLSSIDTTAKSTIEKYPDLIDHVREILFSEEGSHFVAQQWLGILKTADGDYNPDYYDSDIEDDKAEERYSFKVEELPNIPGFIKHIPHLIMPHIKIEKYLKVMSDWQEYKSNISNVFESDYYEYSSFISLYTKYAGVKENHNTHRQRRHSSEDNLKIKQFYFKETENLLNSTLENYFSNDIKNLLDTTKTTYANTYLEEKAIKTTQTLSNNYKVSSLPKNTQHTIEEIQSIYTALQSHKAAFTEDQKFLVDNLFEKRIPEVLQKYFSIDKDYRNTMKNLDGKNAQDLMDESLGNFKNKLTEILDNINAAKLSDLNVTKRYSKSI